VNISEDGVEEHIWTSRSPFLINDQTIEEYEAMRSMQSEFNTFSDDDDSHRRGLYNTTEQSNECKDCIDDEEAIWCPTSNYQSGYCCNLYETCPSASLGSDSFVFPEMQYMLCPNELGC